MYLTRKLQREAIERSNWAVWPIDQDWVKKHISLAALLDLPEITWSRSVANWFRADHEGISVFRRSEQPNVGWFVIRKLSPLSTADGRQVVFRRPADALRAAHLHAYDGLKEAVPISDGLHWQVLPPWQPDARHHTSTPLPRGINDPTRPCAQFLLDEQSHHRTTYSLSELSSLPPLLGARDGCVV
jgi:hypothetical protein